MREDERRAVRRAAATSVGLAVAFTVVTLVGITVASLAGSGAVPVRVGSAEPSPDGLPTCGTLDELAAPAGATVDGPTMAAPGASVHLTVTSSDGEPPRPLTIVVARGTDVVGGHPTAEDGRPVGVVLAGCRPDVATTGTAAAGATTGAGATGPPPLPPGEYELVVIFGAHLPDGGHPTYAGPALTALRRPVTVAAPATPTTS